MGGSILVAKISDAPLTGTKPITSPLGLAPESTVSGAWPVLVSFGSEHAMSSNYNRAVPLVHGYQSL